MNELNEVIIKQTSNNEFDIKIHGDAETLLKGLAAAVCQIISESPLNDQQNGDLIFCTTLTELQLMNIGRICNVCNK